jgi:hypothetical protein
VSTTPDQAQSSPRRLSTGELVHVVITDVKDYDVVAEVLDWDDARIAQSAPFAGR